METNPALYRNAGIGHKRSARPANDNQNDRVQYQTLHNLNNKRDGINDRRKFLQLDALATPIGLDEGLCGQVVMRRGDSQFPKHIYTWSLTRCVSNHYSGHHHISFCVNVRSHFGVSESNKA